MVDLGNRGLVAEMLTTIATISGLFGLTVTTGLLAWQTHATAEQARISNAMASAAILSNAATGSRDILMAMVDHPELYGYFYDGKPCPATGRRRARVLAAVAALADVLEEYLVAAERVPAVKAIDDWSGYIRDKFDQCPALVELVVGRQGWWPHLHRFATSGAHPAKGRRAS